uniref:Uncharacterized protein n=1 Tax=Oryza brachyantha TaxID=4533 RepID=J3MLY7_ORYBR
MEELVILSSAHSIGITLAAPASQINLATAYRSLLVSKCGNVSPTLSSNLAMVNNVCDEEAAAVARSLLGFVPRLKKAKDTATITTTWLWWSPSTLTAWALLTGKEACGHVMEYAENGTNLDFANALVKLSKLPMPVGSKE